MPLPYFASLVLHTNAYPRKNPREHTILVVGDDNAFGYGDKWKASTPGIAGYLESQIQREMAIRQKWRVINRGQPGSTSNDWAPTSQATTVSLVERVLDGKTASEAELVIVILGSHDKSATITAQQTIDNLRAVCEILGEHGKRLVYLINLSTMDDVSTEAESDNNICSSAPDYIRAGPRIDAEYFEFNRTDLFTPDGKYLNGLGYEKLAKDWLLEARPELVKREFAVFQQSMASRK
ncbi:hypothetical protein BDF22DRAFT_741905 [Syncephalis plumigaleata]|nr:hypothetical protein BDF22DRAFT_741905 [Syncephalis plumigaleata]